MKDINFSTFFAGLFITVIVGVLSLFTGFGTIFSGLCMVATAILYACSLEDKKD
ncbi:MAG: hypothetical protein Q4B60_08770 [Erysipelotrichaceae bacterium]|nr:hypothetical protein [Erysipelotrichaceae bacterium]